MTQRQMLHIQPAVHTAMYCTLNEILVINIMPSSASSKHQHRQQCPNASRPTTNYHYH